MLIGIIKSLSLRCPECGKGAEHTFSLCELHKGQSVHMNCSCGADKGIIRRHRKNCMVQIACIICDDTHLVSFPLKQLLKSDYITLCCPLTDVNLAFCGEEKAVHEVTEENFSSLNDLLEEESDGYFHNTAIISRVLSLLQGLSRQGQISCQCGNSSIDIELFPDKVGLSCPQCNSVLLIYAETDEDLSVVDGLSSILLLQGGFKYIDGGCTDSHNKKN